MDVIKMDDNLKAIKIEQLSAIQRESKANIKFYKKQLDKALREYSSDYKGGKQADKVVGWVRKDYFYYKLSLQVYSLTKLAEIMLLSNYNESYLQSISKEIYNYSLELKDDINHILSVIYDYSPEKIDNKVKLDFAKTVKSVGKVVNKTPLKKTNLGGKLHKLSSKTDWEVKGDTKRKADSILTKKDYGTLEPYSDMVNSFIFVLNNKVHIVGDEDEMFVMY